MKVRVDQDLCIGCGVCLDICPEVFEMDGETANVIKAPISSEEEKSVRDAVAECPVEAIIID